MHSAPALLAEVTRSKADEKYMTSLGLIEENCSAIYVAAVRESLLLENALSAVISHTLM
jgi:hypothetical protein